MCGISFRNDERLKFSSALRTRNLRVSLWEVRKGRMILRINPSTSDERYVIQMFKSNFSNWTSLMSRGIMTARSSKGVRSERQRKEQAKVAQRLSRISSFIGWNFGSAKDDNRTTSAVTKVKLRITSMDMNDSKFSSWPAGDLFECI